MSLGIESSPGLSASPRIRVSWEIVPDVALIPLEGQQNVDPVDKGSHPFGGDPYLG
jgi:hypothetical protein